MRYTHLLPLVFSLLVLMIAKVVFAQEAKRQSGASVRTIIEEWKNVEVPPAPKIEAVTLDPKSSAILVLDILQQNCTIARRPRCAASVPRIQDLIDKGRDNGVMIVYSVFPKAAASDILTEVAPRIGEPTVKYGPDKFLNTELENILRSKGVKTVAIVGSAAHGAVLYTAGAAAFRGFQVVVPVDGISADANYAEQYTTSPQPTPFPVSRRVFLRLPVTGAGWIGLVEFVCG